jgi:hypothetical protein
MVCGSSAPCSPDGSSLCPIGQSRCGSYTSPVDPDRASPVVVSNKEVWPCLDMVLKVGNQRTVGGPQAFNKEHPPNLVSLQQGTSSCWSRAPDRLLTLACFSRGSVISNPVPTSQRG